MVALKIIDKAKARPSLLGRLHTEVSDDRSSSSSSSRMSRMIEIQVVL